MAPAAKKTTKQSPTSKRGAAAAGRNIVLLTQECTHAASLAGWLSKQGQNKVYHVHTLRPQKVCSLVLSYGKNEEVPETLQNAETVLRKILPEGKGLKFVIWLDDPLRHHLRLIDQYVREALPASEWERIRGDETEFKALLEKIPASMTTGWVTDELNYLFQTNFYKTDFQGKCFWIGKCGAHDVLFL
ncbi:MAG: hypothetical protein EB121_07285, partial [Alphaproteobacteria bacterium]|nr:hypothetical protein [Alphaproteobacteria bacterium]